MKAKTKKNSSPAKGDVSYRSNSRSNGWTCPPHPLQFVAWVFIAFFAVMFNGMAVPTIPYHWQPAGYIIVNMTLLIHIITHLICLTINPADPNTLRRHKTTMPRFDRTQHNHVIENNHCYLCEVDVGIKSKHCSSCNKCVADFDHHCKWLNNCVGSRNYRWFITCLSSAFLCCLLVFTVFLYLSIVYWVNPRLLHPDLLDAVSTTIPSTLTAEFSTATPSTVTSQSPHTTSDPLETYRNGLAIFSEVSGTAFFVVSIILTVLLFVTLCLLGHLLAFHLYLIYNRMSTYDYVMQDRNLFNSADPESQRPKRRSRVCCKCNNQVSPSVEGKEEMELTNTKKNDTTDQLESNNSNSNLQQHFVVSEPLIKQQQQQKQHQQEQEHVQTSTAVTESKPKKKKRTRRKPHHQRSLTVRKSLQPSLMGHGYPPTGMNLGHSMPQTYLEQHLVRRYSLPLVGPPGMRRAYPTVESVQDLFFTQQFPTMPQPTTNPQRRANPRPQATPHLAPITIDSPTPAQDYHSSSAESLTEIPLGRPQMGSFDGYPNVGRYPYSHEKLHPGYKSHPNLIQSGHQWQPDSGWNQRNLNGSYVKKTKRKLPPRIEDGASYKRVNRNETSKDSNEELRTKMSQASKPKTSTISMSTIADVHHEPEKPVRLNTNQTNDTFEPRSKPKFTERANNSEVSGGSVETRSNEDQKPIAAPRKRTLKPGQTPSPTQSKSQVLERSSSQQRLLESDNRDIVPRSAKPQGDGVSVPGANPKNGSLDHLGSSRSDFKSLDPLKPVASRRSVLLRY